MGTRRGRLRRGALTKSRKGIGQDNANTLWRKIGYSSGLFDIGETHFGLSYGQYNDFAQDGDEATSLVFGIVQDLEPIGSHLWFLVRNHELDRAGNDIFIFSNGALFNFYSREPRIQWRRVFRPTGAP
jgi:hypothetical protein